jgi:hypothetical protein
VLRNALESTALSRNVIKMLCDSGKEPRIAMRGVSMLPLLSEPMVLQLSRYEGSPKLGDVLVFSRNNQLISHRYLAHSRNGLLLLAGDAVAGNTYDVIAPELVVGTVNAVWSDASAIATRVDEPWYRIRGLGAAIHRLAFLRLRQVLSLSVKLVRHANPRARSRPYGALFGALAAVMQNDAVALRACVTAVDPHLLVRMSSMHLCGPILLEGLEASGVLAALPENSVAILRKERWAAQMRTRRLLQQVNNVVDVCNAVGAVPILLKGAARLFKGDRQSDLHQSDDIDVLLPRDQIDAVTTALHERGYAEQPGMIERYAPLHHTAPLFPSDPGVPVELHHLLAAPGEVRTRSDYASFANSTRVVEESGRRLGVLDDFGSALHSVIHDREQATLRNLVILGYQLRRLTPAEIDTLYEVADREDLERHRFHAALYAASRLAGLPLRPTPTALRVFEWRMRRFDLPLGLSIRADSIEWLIATSGRATNRIVCGLLPWENKREKATAQPWRGIRYAFKLPVKVAIILITAVFTVLMPGAPDALKAMLLIDRTDNPAVGKVL